MYLLYLDETGTTEKCKNFVLGGVIVGKNDWKRINEEITSLKKEYCGTVYADLKGLRRNKNKLIDGKNKNYFYHMSPEKRKEFSDKLFKILLHNSFTYIATIINKPNHEAKYRSPINPYYLSYEFLIERFDNFLISKDAYGMIHIEYSNKSLKQNLEKAHEQYISIGTGFQQLKRIIESCHFVAGAKNNFAQVADLFINAVFVNEEYQNNCFFEKYKPFIYSDGKNNIQGWGIKKFP